MIFFSSRLKSTLFILLFCSVASIQGQAAEFRVPSQIATLQEAVDLAASSGDTIIFEGLPWSEDGPVGQSVKILNKNLTLKGTSEIPGTYPTLWNDRFTPYTVQIAGQSNVVIERLQFEGGSRAIQMIEENNQKPSATFRFVHVKEAVRGFYGTANNLNVENCSFSGNEGNGFIIKGFKKLNIQNSGFSNNLNLGLVVIGLPQETIEFRAKNMGLGNNRQAGMWLHDLQGEIDLEQIHMGENRGFNLQITDSSHVSIRDSNFNSATPDDFAGSADGIRLSNSKVSLLSVEINDNLGKGLVAIGRESENPMVDLWQVQTFRSGSHNWVSGQKGKCLSAKWKWLEEAALDRLFADSFESEDAHGNRCFDGKIWEAQVCKAFREDWDANGFGEPPF